MRIVVVGCGYVGLAFAREAARLGHDVVGTTTGPERVEEIESAGVRAEVLRINQRDRLGDVLADRDTAYLCAAAGRRGGDYRQVYLEGVRNLLGASRGTGIKRIVYTSSSGVYGYDDGRWVDEETAPEPRTERARVLADTEALLLSGAREAGIAAAVLRLTGIYGPGREPSRWVARCAGTSRSDGATFLNLVHLDDIVAAAIALLERPFHGVLNLNDDAPTPRRAFYDRLLAEAGLPPIVWSEPDGPPARGKRVCNDRIKQALGLTLQHPHH